MGDKLTYEELEQRVMELEEKSKYDNQLEKYFLESEEKFRLFYEEAPLGYQSLDIDGRLLEVNKAWLDTFGYTKEEVIGKSFGNFLLPQWQRHFKKNFPRFKTIGEVLGVEFGMVKKDGTTITVRFNGRISRNVDGSFRQTRCILQDITEQKLAQEVLRNAHDKLEQIVKKRTEELAETNEKLSKDIEERKRVEEALRESEEIHRSMTNDVLDSYSQVGIFVLDNDFKVIFINKAIEKYFGIKRNNALGKDKKQMIRKKIMHIFEEPEKFKSTVFATYQNNTYVEEFECHILPNGKRKERWLQHKSQPILTGVYAGGRVEHYYDITDLKKTKIALENVNLKLEKSVKIRTIKLQQKSQSLEETIVALKVLMKQNGRDKKELEKKMRSNIENLLLPYLAKLSDSSLDDRQKSYLQIIESNLNNITSSFISAPKGDLSSFTPAEIEITNFVKLGKTSKEISQIMFISTATVNAHRRNIRKKLGIVNAKKNLRSALSFR